MPDPNVSLCDYVDGRFKEIEKRLTYQLNAMERATDVALEEHNRRLAGMNEFREQLNDQADTFSTRSECHLLHDRLDNDIRELREWRASMMSVASLKAVYFAWGLSLLALLIALYNVLAK